ncbi:50S ribosomal protein L6 [Patescibacteria group bacterium]|nr:50S ribosomal protein L6 [Patescibacteria group bacterium]
MSRLAKKPIAIPEGVMVELRDHALLVKGPRGELSRSVPHDITFEISSSEALVKIVRETKYSGALSGTYTSHLRNMIEGVTRGFEKKLAIEGIGYRVEVRDQSLVLHVGFSHPVTIHPAEGAEFKAEKNVITVSGTNKEIVGNEAARIRQVRKPEPYKGKGIRYVGEVIRRKAGKRVATAG